MDTPMNEILKMQCNCELSPIHTNGEHDALIEQIDANARAAINRMRGDDIKALDTWLFSNYIYEQHVTLSDLL